jgi:DNA-binding XRE family transcriptional regulator
MKGLKIQEIEIGTERAVVIPMKTWEIILEQIEELEDERLYDETAADKEETIDHAELCRRLGRSPLRYLRNRAGMTQTELAKRTDLTQSYIAKVEKNIKKLSESSREKICRALGVSIRELE